MDIANTIKDYFTTQEKVQCVYLFGSTTTGKNNKFSDVDVGILFDRGLAEEQYTNRQLALMDKLSQLLKRDVDVIILNKASSFLKFQIIKNGTRIYERPDRTEHSFEARAIMEYFDFLPVRRKLEKSLINRIKGT